MTTGRAPDVARGPRALRETCFVANRSFPELRETTARCQRRPSRALNQRSALPIWKSFQPHRWNRAAGPSVGQPQAGAAAHACTDYEARTASAEPSGLCVTRLLPRPFKARHPASARLPPRGEAARRTRGARGELFPPHCLDIFRRPSTAISRLLRTRCTVPPLARRPLRLTPEVNSGYLRSSARATFSDARVPRKPVCSRHTVRARGLHGGHFI